MNQSEFKNITSPYPLLFPSEKVFLDEDKIIFVKGKKSKEIYYRDIVKIDVEPLFVFIWFRYNKLNDLVLTTRIGKNIKLHNLYVSGTEELLNNIKNINSVLEVNEINRSIFNINMYDNFLIRMPVIEEIANSARIPTIPAFLIIAIISVAVIIFIMYITNQPMVEI